MGGIREYVNIEGQRQEWREQ